MSLSHIKHRITNKMHRSQDSTISMHMNRGGYTWEAKMQVRHILSNLKAIGQGHTTIILIRSINRGLEHWLCQWMKLKRIEEVRTQDQ